MRTAPAADRLDLGMLTHADNQYKFAGIARLADDFMNVYDLRAGRVVDLGAALLQFPVDRLSHPVGAQHDVLPGCRLVRRCDDTQAACAEL